MLKLNPPRNGFGSLLRKGDDPSHPLLAKNLLKLAFVSLNLKLFLLPLLHLLRLPWVLKIKVNLLL